jgi:Aldehyde oxidase and xanthine dehydrogenase, a/b hammerhead domain
LALPGVKAVVTAADFPEIRPEEAFVGEGPMNFRDLSRNVMARDKALYEGHAVAALSPIIAAEAVELIEVEYEVLPHVIDVEAAMAADAPLLHDDLFTQGVEPKPEKPSNIAKRVTFSKGDAAAGVLRGERHRRAALYDQAGAPGLYRAARLRRLGRLRRAGADLGQQPGPVHDPCLLRETGRPRHRQHPRHPG